MIGKDQGLVDLELDRYLKVSRADIQRAAEEYFVKQHATVLTITPAPRGPGGPRNGPGAPAGSAPEEK